MTGDTTAATTAHETAMMDGARATVIAHGTDIIDGTAAAIGAIVGSQPLSVPGRAENTLAPVPRALTIRQYCKSAYGEG